MEEENVGKKKKRREKEIEKMNFYIILIGSNFDKFRTVPKIFINREYYIDEICEIRF